MNVRPVFRAVFHTHNESPFIDSNSSHWQSFYINRIGSHLSLHSKSISNYPLINKPNSASLQLHNCANSNHLFKAQNLLVTL